MGLLIVVVGSMLTIFESVQRSAAFVQDRTEHLDDMRLAIDQMTKEIRQAVSVSPTSTVSRIQMDTYLLGVKRQVVYQAASGKLTRQVDGGAAVVIQQRLSSSSIFTYTQSVTDVQVVGLTLNVTPRFQPDTTLVLTSEARLRNPRATA